MDRKRTLDYDAGAVPTSQRPRIDKKCVFELVKSGNLDEIIKHSDQIDLLHDRDTEKRKTYLHKVLEGCYCEESFNNIKSTLQYILSKAPQLTGVCHRGSTPETPIMMACRLNVYHKAIDLLLQTNPGSVNETHSADKFTPLMNLVCLHHPWKDEVNKKAVFRKSSKIESALKSVELLIASGANINAEDIEGRNALQNVLFSEENKDLSKKERRLNIDPYPIWSEEMIKLLLKNGCNLRSKLTNSHALSYVNSVNEAKLIIEHDASEINCVDSKGETPLHHVVCGCGEDNYEVIEFLIDNGAKVEETDDIFHIAKDEIGYSVVSKLLKKFPNYDVNTKDKHGQTLLMYFIDEQEAIEELLSLGANASLVDNAGNSALSYVDPNQTNAIQAIKLLLEKGADPCQSFIHTSNCILLQICKHILKSNIRFDEWFDLFSNIINLPQMRDITMPENIKEIYAHLFKIIFNFPYLLDIHCSESIWKIHVKCVSQLLSKICTSNESVHSLLLRHNFEALSPSLFNIEQILIFSSHSEVDPFTYGILRASENIDKYKSEKRLEEYVLMMLNSGLLPSKTPDNCITPLTMLFLVLNKRTSIQKEVRLSLCNKLIKNGVNVESSCLKIQKFTASIFEGTLSTVLTNLKIKYYLPDVLYIAFLLKYDECIEMLLPHWWAPPMALFAFHPGSTLTDVMLWAPIFLKYPKIPHGTELYCRVRHHMRTLHINATSPEIPHEIQHLWRTCMAFLYTPQSLMELCMIKIREPLAKEAIMSDTSLPLLLQDELPDYDFPPLLRPVITH